MNATHSVLQLENATVGYRRRGIRRRRDTAIASDLSAYARSGELTALIGPNGAGKSTLLRTIGGLQPTLAGTITIDGIDASALSGDVLARTVALVLTDRIDPGLLTVTELVALGRTPHLSTTAVMRSADHHAVERAMELVDVAGLARRHVSELSDGQRQRTMVARALAQEPRLMVLDEPTSFLDVPSRVELMDVLARLAREQDIAVVISTHELELALRVADQMWLLAEGRLTSGRPQALSDSGAVGAAFDRGRIRFDARRLAFTIDSPDPPST